MRPEPHDRKMDRRAERDVEEATQQKADEIAEERYNTEFDDLPKQIQYQLWSEAERIVIDNRVTEADLRCDDHKETCWDELELMRRLGK